MNNKRKFQVRDNIAEVFAKQLLHIEKEIKALRDDSDRLRHDIIELWKKTRELEGLNGNGINNSV